MFYDGHLTAHDEFWYVFVANSMFGICMHVSSPLLLRTIKDKTYCISKKTNACLGCFLEFWMLATGVWIRASLESGSKQYAASRLIAQK